MHTEGRNSLITIRPYVHVFLQTNTYSLYRYHSLSEWNSAKRVPNCMYMEKLCTSIWMYASLLLWSSSLLCAFISFLRTSGKGRVRTEERQREMGIRNRWVPARKTNTIKGDYETRDERCKHQVLSGEQKKSLLVSWWLVVVGGGLLCIGIY